MSNVTGFAASDWFEIGLAVVLAIGTMLWWRWLEAPLLRLAPRTRWCMAILAVLPVALRLFLLPRHPVPTPDVYDEFSHLLVADTLRHFRLANPTHSMHRFFETFFVLQEPTYSSIYPVGQGLSQAVGWTLTGFPWAGVVLSVSAFCALCYWMLRGWTTPGWALAGGVLAVIEFGPLCLWMNCYWGGSFAAAAGCLVFGALPRLLRSHRTRDGWLLGLGLALHSLARPYETVFLILSIALFFAPYLRRTIRWPTVAKPTIAAMLPIAFAAWLALLQNKQVTGSWTTLPYALSQYQYGVPASLTLQPDPIPHRELTSQQAIGYKMQIAFKGKSPESLASFGERLEYRIRYYRFFFLPPLYLALLAFAWRLRKYRYAWVAMTAVLFALGTNLFPAFQLHYVAALTCVFVLMGVTGLEQISSLNGRRFSSGPAAARFLILLCMTHFCFWYTLHLTEGLGDSATLRSFETWDAINHEYPERRISVNRQLAQTHGKLLVFVRYSPHHIFQEEWVYNEADIDGSRIVWARDLGEVEDETLRRYYPDRASWLLEPDFRPPRLTPYQP